MTILLAAVLALGATTAGATAAGADDTHGAGGAAGPALSVPDAALRASLECHGDLAKRTPVLLVPGTTLTPAEFSWNYVRAFTA